MPRGHHGLVVRRRRQAVCDRGDHRRPWMVVLDQLPHRITADERAADGRVVPVAQHPFARLAVPPDADFLRRIRLERLLVGERSCLPLIAVMLPRFGCELLFRSAGFEPSPPSAGPEPPFTASPTINPRDTISMTTATRSGSSFVSIAKPGSIATCDASLTAIALETSWPSA
jgi:hypothetical protein